MRQISVQRALIAPALFLAVGFFVAAVNSPVDAAPTTWQVQPQDNLVPSSPPTGNAANNEDSNTVVVHEKGLNLLNLLGKGGWFMIPLALLSLLVVAIGIERAISIRREKMLPDGLVRELGRLSSEEGGFHPRAAYQICQHYPSAASRVMRSMLLKVGRPQVEVETATREASEREATRLQSVVSWLSLAAAVAPLIGLLGTVWGISQAFYDTTQLVAGQNKAEVLAQGIYTALVTTLCGLMIAIPAAIIAHFFDNRIVGWFHKIDELIASLTPQIEPFEGRLRTGVNGFEGESDSGNGAPVESQDEDSLPVAAPSSRPR